MPEVSFVIPCLNEAKTIHLVVREAFDFAERSGIASEVVVADNGSTDTSAITATAAGARVIDEPIRGYGSAIRAGLRAAISPVMVIADADGQHDLSETGRLLESIRRGADVVVGRRVESPGSPSSAWLNRRLGTPALSAIGRAISGAGISDFHCGFRAVRREVIDRLRLRSTGMEFASELIVRAHQAGFVLVETDITVRPAGRDRPPHLRPFRDGLRHAACLCRLRMSKPARAPGERSPA